MRTSIKYPPITGSASVQFPSEWPVIRGKVNVNVSAFKAEWTAVDIPSGEDPNAEAGKEHGIAEWNYNRMHFFDGGRGPLGLGIDSGSLLWQDRSRWELQLC